MKTAARLEIHSSRFDLRLAAGCLQKNAKVAAEVLSNPDTSDAHRYNARRLIEVTALNLTCAVQAYLGLM